MKRLLFLIPIAVFVGLAVLLYTGLFLGPPDLLPSPLIGKPAPEVAMPPLDGESQGFTRADLAAGHPTIVNFWASWCAPCREENPTLIDLAKQKGLVLYGVVYEDEPKPARGFLTELGNPFTKIDLDHDGRAGIDWGVTAAPETFVVDGKGIVRQHLIGPLTADDIREKILPIFAR